MSRNQSVLYKKWVRDNDMLWQKYILKGDIDEGKIFTLFDRYCSGT